MSVEEIVINILMVVASAGVLVAAVIFNTKLPPLLKYFDDKTDKAFAIASFVIGDTLLLCALILIANGIIGKL